MVLNDKRNCIVVFFREFYTLKIKAQDNRKSNLGSKLFIC